MVLSPTGSRFCDYTCTAVPCSKNNFSKYVPVGVKHVAPRVRLHDSPVLAGQRPEQAVGPQVPHSFVYHYLVAVGVEQPEAPASTELVELIHSELA